MDRRAANETPHIDEAVMARTYTHTYLAEMRAAAQRLASNL
jgi:hypothetical protein